MLRAVHPRPDRVLVVGPAHAVRRAWPRTTVDVVGTRADDPTVTVVSEALGRASLPRRWNCVVVTDPDPQVERLEAAEGACLPQGLLVILTRHEAPVHPPGTVVEERGKVGDVHVVVARLPA